MVSICDYESMKRSGIGRGAVGVGVRMKVIERVGEDKSVESIVDHDDR